jgi:hypothetical protein
VAVTHKDGKVEFAGKVLGFETSVERIMSDVWADIRYAVVFDGGIRRVPVSNSEFGSYGVTATVDADAETYAAARAFLTAQALDGYRRDRARRASDAAAAALAPAVGRDVTVVRGRKVKLGTSGKVFWMGTTRFGLRVGLKTAAGETVWIAASNVEASQPDEFIDVDLWMTEPEYFATSAAADAAARLAGLSGALKFAA